jgi:two-component system, sensor histidine kinase and response regulator
MVLMLQKLGCEVTVAANGREAVDAWAAGRPELVLMDCHMPEMDGYEATREIRRREASEGGGRAPTRVVALTADAFADNRESCAAAGMDEFVPKPVEPETVKALVAALPRTGLAAGAPAMGGGGEGEPELPEGIRASVADLMANFGPEAVVELLTSYLDDTPGRLAELRTLATGSDRAAFARAAHSLAGSSGIFGLHNLRQAGLELEKKAASTQVPCTDEIVRMENIFGRARPVLAKLLWEAKSKLGA